MSEGQHGGVRRFRARGGHRHRAQGVQAAEADGADEAEDDWWHWSDGHQGGAEGPGLDEAQPEEDATGGSYLLRTMLLHRRHHLDKLELKAQQLVAQRVGNSR